MTLIARLIYTCVLVYRYVRSEQPSPCRFVPSCSSYALEALEYHGALLGGCLIVRRLLRCHPWGGFGVDPVPCAKRCRSAVRNSNLSYGWSLSSLGSYQLPWNQQQTLAIMTNLITRMERKISA